MLRWALVPSGWPTLFFFPATAAILIAARHSDASASPTFFEATATVIPTLMIALAIQTRLFAWKDPFAPVNELLTRRSTALEERLGRPGNVPEIDEQATKRAKTLEMLEDDMRLLEELRKDAHDLPEAVTTSIRRSIAQLYQLSLLTILAVGEGCAFAALTLDRPGRIFLAICGASLLSAFLAVAVTAVRRTDITDSSG